MNSPVHTEIGKLYQVPCVLSALPRHCPTLCGLEWIPIIGPLHEDAEIVGFTPEHWHIDWRFVPDRIVEQRRVRYAGETGLVGLPINFGNAASGPIMKLRKCRRNLPAFPCEKVKWLAPLEKAFADRRMEHMICPHKGIPLHDCPVHDGAVVCMGHGLRWDINSGKLRRTQPA